jgi:tRNA(Ile2) C34 agmatinyltransferase TiaS
MLDPTLNSYLTRCPFCTKLTGVLNVHGHYQCEHCGKNMDECCQGEVKENLETLDTLNQWESLDG